MRKEPVNAEDWPELSRLIDEALEQPDGDRDLWLERLPATSANLKPKLRVLLSRIAEFETRDFLSTLPKIELTPLDLVPASARDAQSGDTLGPYRLLRELGRGGMGEVWLAERVDGLITRPVALKLPVGIWQRSGLAERMAREREILASLTHPNIAHLYDAGLAADGQPFLAIEYVDGKPIDRYCGDHQLDVDARLRLFAQVARAVAYAHSKLVIHRDLKPANILVSADGQARLLDFGIAKLLDGDRAQETSLTALSGRALTPDYASPEQIRGESLSIASDVYSLGVVLYELLCGERPYTLTRDSRGALEDAILLAEPAVPSGATKFPWGKRLRGDLDTILLKSLKKQPQDRYSTAHAFLEDLERYLETRPILARPDSRWYRARKFVLRNKLAVGAATAILTALITGAGFATWQARVARAEQARAEEVKNFIAAFFRDADPYLNGGKTLTATEILQLGREKIAGKTDVDPRVRVELLRVIGESSIALQDNETAEKALLQAVAEARGEIPEHDHLLLQAQVLLAEAQGFLGKTDEARERVATAISILERTGRRDTELFVLAKMHQGMFAIDARRLDEAEQALQAAISIADRVLPADSALTVSAYDAMTNVHRIQGRTEQALELMQKVHDMTLRIYGGNLRHPRIIDTQMGYGMALASVGKAEAGLEQMETSLTNAASVFGPDAMMVGYFSGHLAKAQVEYGELEPAISNARNAVRILVGGDIKASLSGATRLRALGIALLAARRADEALTPLLAAVQMGEDFAAKDGLLSSQSALALAYIQLGRFHEAEVLLGPVIAARREGPPRLLHEPLLHLAILRRLQSRPGESLRLLEEARKAVASEPFNQHGLAQVLVATGLTHIDAGEYDRATAVLEQARELLTKTQAGITPLHADALVGLGRAGLQSREPTCASLEAADAFWRAFDPESRSAGEAAFWLGQCQRQLKRPSQATESLRRAAKLLARSPLPADAALTTTARQGLMRTRP
jgi:eukaryotic-like serine/threonine-protein kinase